MIAGIGNTRELFGDFNDRIGRKVNNKVGPYREEGVNGTRLIDICKYNNLTIKNGFFKHKQIHKYTIELEYKINN